MSKSTAIQDIQAKLRKELDDVANTVAPPSGFTVGTKGKTFTLPNGSQDDGPLQCVILDWISENTYYSGAYNPNSLSAPDCFALNRHIAEMGPSGKVEKPQAELCAECPKNEWGSAPTGKGKACKNTRRLLITIKDADENAPVYILPVSPTGIKHFDKYVKSLEKYDKHPVQVITDISFDPTSAYPSLRFKLNGDHDKLEVMWTLREQNQGILLQERESEKAAA